MAGLTEVPWRSAGTMNVIERAFAVAPSCATIEEIRRLLRQEGYAQVDAHLGGRTIRRQLRSKLRGETQSQADPKQVQGSTRPTCA
jgi:hypothetical protein